MVLGASGAGKSTLSAALAERVGAAHIERDTLWGERVPMESPEFRCAVEDAIAADRWVFDGMPFYVEDIVFAAADAVVCLDYAKPVVMRRVISRSLRQSLLRRHVGVHAPLPFREWRKPDHPVRWSWSTHAERRQQMREWFAWPELAHTQRILLRSPREASRWLSGMPEAWSE